MREVTTRTWCDLHLQRDEQVIAETFSVALNEASPVELDLCDVCAKEVLGPLLAALNEARPLPQYRHPSQKPLGTGVRTRSVVACPICSELGGEHVVNTRASMTKHMEKVHDTPLAVWESAHGSTIDGKPLTHQCDVDGCGLWFSHPAGLGAHKRWVHDVESPTYTKVRRAAHAKRQRDRS